MPFAFIRYLHGSEVVSTDNIWRDKRRKKPFVVADLDTSHHYTILSETFKDPNGKPLKIQGYVCRVAETKDLLKESLNKERACCPPLEARESTKSNEAASSSSSAAAAAAAEAAECLRIKEAQEKQSDLTVVLSEDTDNSSMSLNFGEGMARLNTLVLKVKSESAENGQNRSQSEVNREVLSLFKIIEKEKEDRKIIPEMVSPSTSASSSSGTSRQEEDWSQEVDIGFGYKISRSDKMTLDTEKDKAKWLKTLLIAACGNKASTYRSKPRKGTEPFPPAFLQLAESMYRRFLERRGYNAAAVTDMMKSLGADLAKCATSLGRSVDATLPAQGKRKRSSLEQEDLSEPDTILDSAVGDPKRGCGSYVVREK